MYFVVKCVDSMRCGERNKLQSRAVAGPGFQLSNCGRTTRILARIWRISGARIGHERMRRSLKGHDLRMVYVVDEVVAAALNSAEGFEWQRAGLRRPVACRRATPAPTFGLPPLTARLAELATDCAPHGARTHDTDCARSSPRARANSASHFRALSPPRSRRKNRERSE